MATGTATHIIGVGKSETTLRRITQIHNTNVVEVYTLLRLITIDWFL